MIRRPGLLVLLAGAAAALAGCAAAGDAPAPAPTSAAGLAELARFAGADLEAAAADATRAGDAIAAPCWAALAALARALPGEGAAAPVGAFSAFQRARDLRLGAEAGVPLPLRLACAPLVVDEQALLLRLGAIGAGRALMP